MARFYIEVPHEAEKIACAKAVKIFLQTGSHFLTNADWGCLDGDHNARIIVDVNTRDDALEILPPAYRPQAKIVKLNKWTMESIEEFLHEHE